MSNPEKKTARTISIIVQLLLVMYIIQIINVLTPIDLRMYGIIPKDTNQLWGIVTAPFIHGSWLHLINNSFGFATFSAICLFKGANYYFKASVIIILLGGVLVWCFARNSVHIGASGWVFGLWSLIIATAWFERSFMNIVISIAVIFFYGTMIFGVLPQQAHISFESHLFGAIAGIVAASILAKNKPKTQR